MAYPRWTTVGVWRCVRESTTSMKSFAVGTCVWSGDRSCGRRERSVAFAAEGTGGTTRDDRGAPDEEPDAAASRFADASRRRRLREEPRRRRRRRHFSRRAAESRGGSTHRGDLLEVILHARHGCFRLPRAPLEGWAGACLAVPSAGRRLSRSSFRREFFARLAREAADSGENHSVCAFSLMNDNVTIFGIWQSPSSVEKCLMKK
jgi:hypothetical protein